MAVASKKTIKKSAKGSLYYNFGIKESEIVERGDFGSFEVIKTKRGIMFKTYTGFHVWTTPYAVGTDGKAHKMSLYSWLEELLAFKLIAEGHEDELIDDTGVKKGDILEAMKITTEANLTRSMVVFTDRDYAIQEANRYMDWLKEQTDRLIKTMKEKPQEEDLKADAEFNAKIENQEIIEQIITDIADEQKDK